MSVAIISYRSLEDASKGAENVAKKLETYANHLDSQVYAKLNNYRASHEQTSNIQSAKDRLNRKMQSLREKSTAYSRYSRDLSVVKETCLSTDKAVRATVSRLTGNFKSAHGIVTNVVAETMISLQVQGRNKTFIGRWMGDTVAEAGAIKEYIEESVKDWWNYEGGQQLVTGVVEAVCAVVLAVGLLLGSLLSGNGIVLAVAGLILATINGITNIINESRAYEAVQNGDPALGRRLSAEDTVQETLRRESDSEVWHMVAEGFEIAGVVIAIASLLQSAVSLIKNVYGWTTGSMANLKDLRVKDILTKGGMKEMMRGAGSSIKNGWKNLTTSLKTGNFSSIKEAALNSRNDFLNNLKDKYLNFDTIEEGMKSVGSIGSLTTEILKKDFSLKSIGEQLRTFVLENWTIGRITTYDSEKGGGILSYKDSWMTASSFSDMVDKLKALPQNGIFQDDPVLGQHMMDKFSKPCSFHIDIPHNIVPAL